MNALNELMSNIHWMIHDLVDGDQIDNDEEKRLEDIYEKAKGELAAKDAVIEAAREVLYCYDMVDDEFADAFWVDENYNVTEDSDHARAYLTRRQIARRKLEYALEVLKGEQK